MTPVSQSSDMRVFSVRIVSIDYYMAPPIPAIDISYSTFQGEKVNEVPVIRVYGSTPAGQKTCLHIHRAFPYLYVPCSDIPLDPNQEGGAFLNTIFLALEKALKHKGSAGSKKQHVHNCSLVRAKRFYGYHSSEELFVKIYLYYPQDVARTASLLLGGAVLDKSLQPHESHIPYILQFLVDYNLYGMGHVHLSKIKFRDPVPDVLTSRNIILTGQNEMETYMTSGLPARFQAGSSNSECSDFPVWTSSTIPYDWLWQSGSQLEASPDPNIKHVKRQSVCQLEADTSVDDILNQQFKMYVPLSQTHTDVKMVQSLIAIWEEEYERTGMHEPVMLHDPGKPMPEDVLRVLSSGVEFEKNLTALCSNLKNEVPLSEQSAKLLQQVAASNNDVFVELGNVSSASTNEVSSDHSKERIFESLLSQESKSQEQVDTTPDQSNNTRSKSLVVSETLSGTAATRRTVEVMAPDAEVLSLLRWLANSEASEDINSDDELVRETILSPLLPASTVDKVLEKANTDYENESQKECQDILDSVKDVIDVEGLKEIVLSSQGNSSDEKNGREDNLQSSPFKFYRSSSKMQKEGESNRFDHQLPQTTGKRNLSEERVSHGDDFLHSFPSESSGKTPKTRVAIGEESLHSDSAICPQNQSLRVTGITVMEKQKKRKLLWGSLPFSTVKRSSNDLKTARFKTSDIPFHENKDDEGTPISQNEEKEWSDLTIRSIGKGSEEQGTSVGCSVRDLMRRKRYHRDMQHDYGSVEPEGRQEVDNSLMLKCLDFSDQHENNTDLKENDVPGCISSGHHKVESVMYVSCAKSPSEICMHSTLTHEMKVESKCPFSCQKQDTAVASGCGETNGDNEFKATALILTEALASNSSSGNLVTGDKALTVNRSEKTRVGGSNSLDVSHLEHAMVTSCELRCHHARGVSVEKLCNTPNDSLMDMHKPTVVRTLKNESYASAKHCGDSESSLYGTSGVNREGNTENLIGMTFSKKPPSVDWEDRVPANSFYPPDIFGCQGVKAENKDGASEKRNALDEFLPFFEGASEGKNVLGEKSNNEEQIQQQVVIGVPSHYRNDGSQLYLLTPVFSPPSADSVYTWLLEDHDGGTSGQINDRAKEIASTDAPCETRSGSSLAVDGKIVGKLVQKEELVQGKNMNPSAGFIEPDVKKALHGDMHAAGSSDISQISGPDRLKLTALSQIGFQDPASVGAGQQLTLLSIEVQSESRGDLRPDPRFDAINVIALAFQDDRDSRIDVYVLLRANAESGPRSADGICGSTVLVSYEEMELFSHFINIIRSFDPDVLMGWDIQGGSLGFLAERAAVLGIGLLKKISRTPFGTNIGEEETEASNTGILDNLQHEPLIADLVPLEEAVIEDEWGRTHASGVHVGGRVVLNVWRLTRSEVKLHMYSLEAISESVLRQKVPLIPHKVLTKWFSSGSGRAKYRCIEYTIQRAKLNLDIMNQLDMVNRTSELARVFGIDFFSVLSRGSQYRVESMFLRLAHTQNYLAISPGNQQVASQPAMECLPLVMEPESNFYSDPVAVLDFQSLYPSMIIAYNLCYCTYLGDVAHPETDILGVTSFSPNPQTLRDLKENIILTPNGVMYVPPKVRKGILPRLLEEILSTRIMVKQAMKKLTPSQQVLHRVFDARQLALKLIANVTYGYTAAGFSGRMPCAELADSIVQCGRSTLEKAVSLVNANDNWKAKVIYGDTDSMFVLLKDRSIKEAFKIGQEIASAVTAINPSPVTLKLEKVYSRCFLLTKKRYVGYSYESPDQVEPVFDAKGIETVRRDTCGAVAKTMEQSIRLFFEHQNISEVKSYLERQWTRILSGRVSIQDFVFAKEVRLGTYSARTTSSLPPAAIIATKAMRVDPRAEPRYAERVPYVVIHGEPGARLVDMVVDPQELLAIDSPYRLNNIYYITKQIIPALQRVFGLVGADLNQWFSEMPRPATKAFAKSSLHAANPQRKRIDYYYLSKHCIVCGELVHASAHVCDKCMENEAAVLTTVIGRTSKLERDIQHLIAICRHCGGGDWIVESGVKCTSLACSVYYERRKVQKELQGLSAVASDKGLYPKCMVEWF